MDDLNRALIDIRDVRRQVAQTTQFHGYGPLTLSATAVLAALAGVAQTVWLQEPGVQPRRYIALWLVTAVVSSALIAAQMVARSKRLHHGIADEMIRMAVVQFLPAGIAGAVLPFVLLRVSHDVFWMLPGLWQILFSLGVFASCRCLQRPMVLVGAWFLCTGMVCLLLGDARALSPATMAMPYVVGMALVAAVHLYYARKAGHEQE